MSAFAIVLTACVHPGGPGPEGYALHQNAHADIQAALNQAQADHKLVLLEFGADWCPPCQERDALLQEANVAYYLEDHFHLVYIDVGNFDRNRDITQKFGFVTSSGIPAEVVLAPNGALVGIERGSPSSDRSSAHGMLRWLSAWVDPGAVTASKIPLPTTSVEMSQVRSSAETLVIRSPRRSAGTFATELTVAADSVVSTLVTAYNDSLVQRVRTIHDPRSLYPTEVWDSTWGEQVHIVYAGGRVHGMRVTPNRPGAPDTVYFDLFTDWSAIDRRNLAIIIPRLVLVPGTRATIVVFDSWALRTNPVHLTIGSRAPLALPAGSLDAYRVDVTGDIWNLPQTWYVSADPPRRILRGEWPEKVVLELAR